MDLGSITCVRFSHEFITDINCHSAYPQSFQLVSGQGYCHLSISLSFEHPDSVYSRDQKPFDASMVNERTETGNQKPSGIII